MRSILFVTLAILLTGCFSYKEVVMHDIVSVEVQKFDAHGIQLLAHVRLENPNGYKIQVKKPDVDLYLNGAFVGKGRLTSPVILPRRSSEVHEISMQADLKGLNLLLVMLGSALSGEAKIGAKGTVMGQAGLARKRFPFDVEESVNMRSLSW